MKILIKRLKQTISELKLFYITSFIAAILIITPIFNFLIEGVKYVLSGNFSLGIAGGEEVLGTLKVLALTSLFGGGLGTLNGWLLSNCDFKFRKALRICQLVPLAAPAYLITAVLQDLGSIFGYQVTGLWWGVLILSISTYPYVFILANESFNKFGVNQINASRGLGVGPWKSFFKIAIPMALPALITGISLMCMEVMNELGTFALLNIPSISTGIAENWIIEGNPRNAIGLSLVALLIIFSLIIFEKFSRRKSRRWSENPASKDSQVWKLKKTRAFLALTISLFPPIFSFGIPCFWVLLNIDQIQKGLSMELLTLSLRTISLGLFTALITMLFSLIISLARRPNKSPLLGVITNLAGIGYAIPGAVLALSLISVSSSKFNFVAICSLIWAYIVRFLTISKGSIDSSLERISPSIDEAASGLGENWLGIIKRIHLPLLQGPIFVGSLLVFVDTIKELPITFILRPFDFDTLSVRIYQYAGDERMVEAILPAILIMTFGLIAAITLIPSLEKKTNSF
ncbi:iron ABC transporter permease [Prochlorococcus marinus XMU1419]|uniref:ABC transporter permease n=1 Tax=Prochlorococcus marinus TaxID=1219 RepID=UPI001ADABD3E|nr:iron ABC transporter permease [Prochlorococcus marinus]MBO8233397.1 iron ABC transporter permease [Prochlorococcus marinus XMU1419]MBW3076877.1 iron ABC transporter [Prochlorococcus marinus str. XMU1419]